MTIDQLSHDSLDEFLQQPRLRRPIGDGLIQININRSTLIAILLSLLIHAFILFFSLPSLQMNTASSPPPRAMEVSLAPPKPPEVVTPMPPVEEKPAPKFKSPRPKVMTQKMPAREKPIFSVPATPELIAPKESKEQPTDMMSYVKSRQAHRQVAEADAAKQNAEAIAREVGPSEAAARDEKIKRNMQSGTNGIFEITSLSNRHATFAFRGWTNDYSSSRREFFEVEASTGQDIRLVMVKRMIKLIREHYQGDFNWDSHRLNRVVNLSARPQDNEGLEEFMLMEFFGQNYKSL
jgi:hypothetical protein